MALVRTNHTCSPLTVSTFTTSSKHTSCMLRPLLVQTMHTYMQTAMVSLATAKIGNRKRDELIRTSGRQGQPTVLSVQCRLLTVVRCRSRGRFAAVLGSN